MLPYIEIIRADGSGCIDDCQYSTYYPFFIDLKSHHDQYEINNIAK